MPLYDTTCKNAKPKDKPYKLADSDGLYLLVHPNGSKYFRLKYRFLNTEKTLALGIYPEISLVQAREDTKEARKLLRTGVDPTAQKKAVKQALMEQHNQTKAKKEALALTFEVIAREWGFRKVSGWDELNNRSRRMLERNIFPWLGNKQITEIRAVDVLECLRRVEDRGAIETAHRTLQICGQVFRYAVATGRLERGHNLRPERRIATSQRQEFCRPDGCQAACPAITGD